MYKVSSSFAFPHCFLYFLYKYFEIKRQVYLIDETGTPARLHDSIHRSTSSTGQSQVGMYRARDQTETLGPDQSRSRSISVSVGLGLDRSRSRLVSVSIDLGLGWSRSRLVSVSVGLGLNSDDISNKLI